MASKKFPAINNAYEIRQKHMCSRCNAVLAANPGKTVPQWFYRSRTNVDLGAFPSIDQSFNFTDPTQASVEKVNDWLERIPNSDSQSSNNDTRRHTTESVSKDFKNNVKLHVSRPNYYDAWYSEDADQLALMTPIPIGKRVFSKPSHNKRKSQSFSNSLLPNISSKFRDGGGPIGRPHTPPRFSMMERHKTRMLDIKPEAHKMSYMESFDKQQGRTYELHDRLKTMLNST